MISSSKGINREDQVAAKQWISGPSLKQASYLVIVVAMIALASIAKAGVWQCSVVSKQWLHSSRLHNEACRKRAVSSDHL